MQRGNNDILFFFQLWLLRLQELKSKAIPDDYKGSVSTSMLCTFHLFVTIYMTTDAYEIARFKHPDSNRPLGHVSITPLSYETELNENENGDNKGKPKEDTCKECWMKQTL